MPSSDTQFKPGAEWKGNAGGRPKNTMKEYLRRKFMELSDEEKEAFLKEYKVAGVDQIKLAEGNPAQGVEHSGEITQKQYIIKRGDNLQNLSENQESPTEQGEV